VWRVNRPRTGQIGERLDRRSHQAIIEVPSRLFYERSLEQCGDEGVINSMLDWEMLPGKRFPVLFYGVLGQVRPTRH
jgi:hypothetical protein